MRERERESWGFGEGLDARRGGSREEVAEGGRGVLPVRQRAPGRGVSGEGGSPGREDVAGEGVRHRERE